MELARGLPFNVDLWQVQNVYWTMLHTVFPEVRQRALQGSDTARQWVEPFVGLGDKLGVPSQP